ncbi:Uncharacterized protein dnm_083520 [Desulfonema magnum]|uniref:Bro-N domain-containing protein n=2 Tax=Desulfonema magnum TaxID=45655 RepID=A0A975GSP3_9BACT|nr:Uncharacterized protein dnm_083520 [Desulfonema magnum]
MTSKTDNDKYPFCRVREDVPEKLETSAACPTHLTADNLQNKKDFIMKDQNVTAKSDSTPLPLVVAEKWEFRLNFHVVEGEHFYAIEDWIVGITGCDVRKAQLSWAKLQKQLLISNQQLSHTAPNGRVYQKDHTDDHGLYLIAQNLRVTKNRPALRAIKDYLAKAGVFADHLRTNKDGARDRLREELNAENPDKAMEEAVAGYRKQQRDDRWIDMRLKGVGHRLIFSSTLADTCKTRPDFAGATNAGYKELFDMVKAEIVKTLGLTKSQARKLRDHLSELALQGISLYESAASHKMRKLGRVLTRDEQVQIVRDCAVMITPGIHQLADYLGIDLLSGKNLIAE